jgi:ribosome-binding protein aMBF1 (putative translation factor)
MNDTYGIVNNCLGVVLLRRSIARNTKRVMLTPAQLRAARALLGWSQAELVERCGGIGQLATIKRFETGKSDPKQSTLIAWRRALSKAGVEFIDGDDQRGPGVRLRDPQR